LAATNPRLTALTGRERTGRWERAINNTRRYATGTETGNCDAQKPTILMMSD
jgi:hypothetical protein